MINCWANGFLVQLPSGLFALDGNFVINLIVSDNGRHNVVCCFGR